LASKQYNRPLTIPAVCSSAAPALV
jgi:hypothetical protein